ncbi:uncharacterized protein LOC111381382 [Olea europaea var. sylvestris]|uniref:uncharacterized protein LOC111381382 n=1 Tax=Olea europaea var. sylvestris TaxID=158386 RepID=UPI000C1D7DF8|nr:uncharacterized protein LOC111381382 [Olea europaea var. sylvestris]
MSVSNPPVLDPLQPPPMAVMAQQAAYTAHSGHGSVGPVIGILAVITILCALSVMIGRLCSGRRVMGYQGYDLERWVETKCSSCIDGSFNTHPSPRMEAEHRVSSSSDAVPALETPSEATEEQVEVAEQHTNSQDEHPPHERAES